MKCPFCSSDLNKVVDKRSAESRGEIRRRRECLKCGKRFTTYESLARLQILVIKKDGRKEPYDQEKVLSGAVKALEKRPGIEMANKIVEKIEAKIRAKGMREVPTAQVGRWVLAELKKLDQVAYLRFASVYRTFTDPKDFEKELKILAE